MKNENKDVPFCRDLRPEWSILIPVVLMIALLSIPSLIATEATEAILTKFNALLVQSFGSVYLWITMLLIVACGYFALSKYGDIKFGDKDEEPEIALTSWIAMIFCSGVAGASLFWAIVEPQWNLINPPQHVASMSVEAYEWSLAYLLLHWGPNAWCSYFICALPIAFIFHIKKTPQLRISATLENILGKQTNGIIGRAIDVFFIIGLFYGTTTTMVLSLPTVEAALATLFGLQTSFALQVVILVFCTMVAAVSLYFGLKKGIQNLSRINIVIALAMIFYAFALGPTAQIFSIFTNGIGKMLGNYMNMTFWTDPFSPGTFPQDWTIFYTLFWAAYGPFMGLFIARISRGRTVRELILWGTVGTMGAGYLIHGVYGSYTLWLQYSGTLDVVGLLQTVGGPASMMAVLDSLPFGKIIIVGYCAYSVIFLATTIDSSCYVVASSATRRMNHDEDPNRFHRVFWAFCQATITLGALAIGGIGVAKMYGNIGGLFMAIPIVLLFFSWVKILNNYGLELLAHYGKPERPIKNVLFEDESECAPAEKTS